MMYSLIIVGAGGLGRVVMSQALGDTACRNEWFPMGYLDTRPRHELPPVVGDKLLGNPLTFVPRYNDLFIAAVGDPELRKKLVVPLIERGAEFTGLRTKVSLGERCVIGRSNFSLNVSIGPDCRIGDYCFIDQGTVIGHDVTLGDYCHLGVNVCIAGGVTLGVGVVVNSGALIGRGVTIGDGVEIGMGSVVLRDVAPGALVMGNPARVVR